MEEVLFHLFDYLWEYCSWFQWTSGVTSGFIYGLVVP
jgi:hypothetical protein